MQHPSCPQAGVDSFVMCLCNAFTGGKSTPPIGVGPGGSEELYREYLWQQTAASPAGSLDPGKKTWPGKDRTVMPNESFTLVTLLGQGRGSVLWEALSLEEGFEKYWKI